MEKSRRRRYESQVQVRRFYTDRRSIFDGSALGQRLLAEHDEVVTNLDGYFVAESSGRRAAHETTISRAESRNIVRGVLESLSRASRLLPVDDSSADDRFPVPRRASDRQLLADAKACCSTLFRSRTRSRRTACR